MNQLVPKSSLSLARQRLVELFQNQPFCRIEYLGVVDGDPRFTASTRVIQKLKMGSEAGVRPEAARSDFLLKQQVVDMFQQMTEIANGEVLSIEVRHGLPFSMEVEHHHASGNEDARA